MNNPLAFPIVETAPNGSVSIEPGMSLRDYFAAKAMQEYLSGLFDEDFKPSKEHCAQFAYEMADAMLVERERGGQA